MSALVENRVVDGRASLWVTWEVSEGAIIEAWETGRGKRKRLLMDMREWGFKGEVRFARGKRKYIL